MDKDIIPRLRAKNERYTIYDMDIKGITQSVTYLNPRQSTQGHSHPQPESYYIAFGFGALKLGEEWKMVKSGDMVYIPPNTFHQLSNEGDMTMVFVCAFSKEVNEETIKRYMASQGVTWLQDEGMSLPEIE